jgi:hypothetical protein
MFAIGSKDLSVSDWQAVGDDCTGDKGSVGLRRVQVVCPHIAIDRSKARDARDRP